MSITALSDPDKFHKKSIFHERNDSGELDVFEAARYFSGYHEVVGYNATNSTQNKIMGDEIRPQGCRVGRMSLDVPIMRNSLPHRPQHGVVLEKQMKEKKCKQPSSPGGRLASFLNSLFSQSASKKKKSKSASQSMKDDQEESPGGRRKRRSSISHFSRSSNSADSKSIHSASSASGFRTPPPPHAQTPTKSYRDFGSYSEYHKQMMSLSKYDNGQARSTALHNDQGLDIDKIRNKDLTWLDEKVSLSNGFLGKYKNFSKEFSDKEGIWVDKSSPEEKGFRSTFGEEDDGAESDSSSDLFELQNYDLGDYSSGLPVYETTNMDSIKKGTKISNGNL